MGPCHAAYIGSSSFFGYKHGHAEVLYSSGIVCSGGQQSTVHYSSPFPIPSGEPLGKNVLCIVCSTVNSRYVIINSVYSFIMRAFYPMIVFNYSCCVSRVDCSYCTKLPNHTKKRKKNGGVGE